MYWLCLQLSFYHCFWSMSTLAFFLRTFLSQPTSALSPDVYDYISEKFNFFYCIWWSSLSCAQPNGVGTMALHTSRFRMYWISSVDDIPLFPPSETFVNHFCLSLSLPLLTLIIPVVPKTACPGSNLGVRKLWAVFTVPETKDIKYSIKITYVNGRSRLFTTHAFYRC